MRKKILLILILSIMIILPNNTYAAGCANCSGSGGGTGNGSRYQGAGCDEGNCTKSGGGVRLTLYSYKGSGTPKKIGDGIDIWGSGFYTPAKVTSPADSDVLKDRKKGSCNVGRGGYSLSGYPTYTWDQYKQKSTYFVEDIYDDISDGSIADWLYNAKTGKGWLKTKLFNPMLNGDYASVAKLFNTTESVIKDNSENLYIVAELITQIILTPGSKSVYSGTVSEISTNVIFTDYINHMYINNSFYDEIAEVTDYTEPFGKLVGKSNSNKYLTAASGNGFYPNLSGDYRFTTGLKGDLCGKPYGLAVWYLAVCCPECVKSCDTECVLYSKGTTERQACALKYCSENEADNSNCVNSCVGNVTDKGCDETINDGVYQKCNSNDLVTNYNGEKVCDETTDAGEKCSNNKELEGYVCYDEESNLSIPGESIDNTVTKDLGYKYYRIECNEKLIISNGVDVTKILQFENRSSDLHIGLSATFEKSCDLKFKKRNKIGDVYTYTWEIAKGKGKDTDAMITKDIAIYDDYAKKTSGTLKADYEAIVKKLKEIYNRSYDRLSYVTALDTNEVVANTKIEVINSSLTDSQTVTMELKPVYCESGNATRDSGSSSATTSLKCTLTEEEVYSQEDNSIICGNDGAANVVVESKSGGTGHYKYSVHYATTSTWNSSYGDTSQVYIGNEAKSGKEECLTAVAAFNGYCSEIENAYRFEPFTASVKTTSTEIKTKDTYEIYISGYGSCGQIKFGCCGSYEFVDGNQCNKCMDYDPTSQDYLNCYKAYCSCDVICGSNVSCRAKYCPLECEGCLNEFTDYDEQETCDGCINKCNTDFPTSNGGGTNANLLSNIICRYDCCNNECDVANDTCRYDCCTRKCRALDSKNLLGYMGYKATQSMTALEVCYQDCKCPNGNCGNDYYYRTINQERPFPERTAGANWYNKVEYITESENSNGRYYDATNGKDGKFEYKISLSSEDIKKIRNDANINTTYAQKKSSDEMANLDDRGVYCSYLLYDYLYNELNIQIETGSNGVYGSGCANIG